jgi:hypothetical protein
LEEYSKKLAKSVMKRAEAICRNFDATNVGQLILLYFSPTFFLFYFIFNCLTLNLGFNLQINIEKVVGTGEAKNVICNAAKKLEADTLVMGSHGYGFFKR